ncbi:hypothetical protein K435DRAFT_802414 [Dendrothele bispora CBS 962.96]|uniref:Uncharacterized protein n=1 Tax=Dendrothele bispora (strain CBS 962.96) TaxID=1314807 RepID=A0A4S8LME1_DENBC|nr:hypothetical protein K435DRAFT_802414 [Dendrothele bispora CBS 962.96]
MYQSVLTGKGSIFIDNKLDLSLPASDDILASREARKAVTPVYAYQGSGSRLGPPITWSFYQVRSHEYWTQLTKEQQKKKTLTVTEQTEEKYVVGPLDFCGTAVVVKHGNGYEIFYASHPDFEQISSLLQKDLKPIFWFRRKLMQLTKKFIRKERKKTTSWTVAVRLRGRQPGKARNLLPTNSIIVQHFKKLRSKAWKNRRQSAVGSPWLRKTSDRIISEQMTNIVYGGFILLLNLSWQLICHPIWSSDTEDSGRFILSQQSKIWPGLATMPVVHGCCCCDHEKQHGPIQTRSDHYCACKV